MQSTKGIVMVEGQLVSALQVLGWILTLLGQVQVARKRRAGFATWIGANIVTRRLGGSPFDRRTAW